MSHHTHPVESHVKSNWTGDGPAGHFSHLSGNGRVQKIWVVIFKCAAKLHVLVKEDLYVNDELRASAVRLDTGEVCWSVSDVREALRQIASKGRVLLGFDLFLQGSGGALESEHGCSGYDVLADLVDRTWSECVELSLARALGDVDQTATLSGRAPPFDGLFYCVTSVNPAEARKLGLNLRMP